MTATERWSEQCKALALLSLPERERLMALLSVEHYRCGATLIRQGRLETHMYFLIRGYVEVLVETDSGQQLLTMLSSGSYVGEAALFTERPRSATVRAATDVEVLALERAIFQTLLDDEPRLAARLLQGLLSEHLDRLQRTSAEMISQKVLYSRYATSALST